MIPSNVSIRARSIGLVEFMYPNYQVVHQFSPLIEGGVIFDGDPKYLQMFRDNNIPYIYVKGSPEYDLTVVDNFISFVYSKWNKNPPKYVVDYLLNLDKNGRYNEIELILKQVWVTGKCEIIDDSKMISFFSSLADSGALTIIRQYLELTKDYDCDNLFNQIQSYLKMTTKPDTVTNAWLRRLVDKFNHGERYRFLKPALYNYLYTNASNNDIKMMKLLSALSYKGGNEYEFNKTNI